MDPSVGGGQTVWASISECEISCQLYIKRLLHPLILASSPKTASMHCSTTFLSTLFTASLVRHGLTSPLPQGGYGSGINNDNVPGLPVGPTGATSSPYGPDALLGNDGSTQDTADSAIVSDYKQVPGQRADADIGLYLDFSKTPNPQPIRGNNGNSDAGPRMNISIFSQT